MFCFSRVALLAGLGLALAGSLAPAHAQRVAPPTEQTAADDTKPDKEKRPGFLKRLFKGKDKSEPGAETPESAGDATAPREERPARAEEVDTAFNKKQEERLQRLNSLDEQYQQALRSGKLDQAQKALERYKQVQDSLVQARLEVELALQEAEAAKRAAHENELEAKAAQLQNERQELVLYGLIALAVLFLGLALAIFRALRLKRRSAKLLSEKNLALEQANEEIRATSEALDLAHKDVVDSIAYARRIQEAILPQSELIQQHLPASFILYRPKDIVSGDFYWFHRSPGRTLLAAVDCTGHGVPGAFMSVLGMSLLNQIVDAEPHLLPGEVLNRLHQRVIAHLKQQEGATNQDGMDIALVALTDGGLLQFAGANNPVYLVKQNSLVELDGEKAPIGGSRYVQHRFSTQEMQLEAGDTVYLFSDGLPDQFGGPKGKKFTYKRLRELLMEVQNQSLSSQQRLVGQALDRWRGNYEQTDDILLLGFKVPG